MTKSHGIGGGPKTRFWSTTSKNQRKSLILLDFLGLFRTFEEVNRYEDNYGFLEPKKQLFIQVLETFRQFVYSEIKTKILKLEKQKTRDSIEQKRMQIKSLYKSQKMVYRHTFSSFSESPTPPAESLHKNRKSLCTSPKRWYTDTLSANSRSIFTAFEKQKRRKVQKGEK